MSPKRVLLAGASIAVLLATSVASAQARIILSTAAGPLSDGAEVRLTNTKAFELRTAAGVISCAPDHVTLTGELERLPKGVLTSATLVECNATLGLGPVELTAAHLPWQIAIDQGWTPKGPPTEGTVPIKARGMPAITATFPEAQAACHYVAERQLVKESSLGFEIGEQREPRPVEPRSGHVDFERHSGSSPRCPKEAELVRGITFVVTSGGEAVLSEWE